MLLGRFYAVSDQRWVGHKRIWLLNAIAEDGTWIG